MKRKVSGYTHSKEELDHYANQNSPNNKAYRANRNNHSNQCNPNNPRYAGRKSSNETSLQTKKPSSILEFEL